MIVSHHSFMLFVTFASLLICAVWGARDVYLLVKHLPRRARADWKDHRAWRDLIFGSVTGVIIILLGLFGVWRYWN